MTVARELGKSRAMDESLSLGERFLGRCLEDLEVMQRALAEPAFQQDPEFVHIVHRMAGAGGLFGFPRLSRMARALNDALVDKLPYESKDIQAIADELSGIAGRRIAPEED